MTVKQKPLSTPELVEIYENLKEIQELNSNVTYRKRNYYSAVNTDKLQKQITELKAVIMARLEM